MQASTNFEPGQRVHAENDPRRIGTVKYVGPLDGYPGSWVGVDWDTDDGKHDGTHNGVRYFQARSDCSGSFVRSPALSPGISLVEALHARYADLSSKEEEDEMYVLSTNNKRVSVELVGRDKIQQKLSRLDELSVASLSYMGVCDPDFSNDIRSIVPNLQELDLTGNLLSKWKDVEDMCEQLKLLHALNLSNNLMGHNVSLKPCLHNIRVLVLNNTGIIFMQVDFLQLPVIEELHLMSNKICKIEPICSSFVKRLQTLRVLNLDDNFLTDWDEILKLSLLGRLEQLYVNKNKLKCISYPNGDVIHDKSKDTLPFQNLRCLFLGGNEIGDFASIDALNAFPKLVDVRLSENPVSDPAKGGVPRYVLIARLSNIKTLNGSEVGARERKESEIRYVRLVMSSSHDQTKIEEVHPRFLELKRFHEIEDERSKAGVHGPQKMSLGLISMTLKCVGPTIAHKETLVKKLPATTSVGRLKILCESLFKLNHRNLKLFLQETCSPLPIPLNDDLANLLDVGVSEDSIILVDETLE